MKKKKRKNTCNSTATISLPSLQHALIALAESATFTSISSIVESCCSPPLNHPTSSFGFLFFAITAVAAPSCNAKKNSQTTTHRKYTQRKKKEGLVDNRNGEKKGVKRQKWWENIYNRAVKMSSRSLTLDDYVSLTTKLQHAHKVTTTTKKGNRQKKKLHNHVKKQVSNN